MTESANNRQVGGEHFKNQVIQTWDFIAANNIGFFEGNAIKYLSRWRSKGGVEDLKKAIHYIEKLIELEIQEDEQRKIMTEQFGGYIKSLGSS